MKRFKLIRKITVVTGSRADYGLLKNLMKLIQSDPSIRLQIIATGSHLSKKHGLTYKEIEEDGFEIEFKLQIIENFIDSQSTSRAMGIAQNEISKILITDKPDLMLVLGDRYEILSAAIAALLLRVPVAHIHGGEKTLGSFDDSIRNAVTKMSYLHFVATELSKKRVVQMGENPRNVFNVGGLGVDAIYKLQLLSRDDVELFLQRKLGRKNLLVTYHPETISEHTPIEQIRILLDALARKRDTNLIFTGVNADPGSEEITSEINAFVQSNSNAMFCSSLGQKNYLSTILYCDGVVGNSSSGILEVPSFKKATVNVGKRQHGREFSKSVIDCPLDSDAIANAIDKIYTKNFEIALAKTVNVYGEPGASERIYQILKKFDLKDFEKKEFYDL